MRCDEILLLCRSFKWWQKLGCFSIYIYEIVTMGVTEGFNCSASMIVKQPNINSIIIGAKPSAWYSKSVYSCLTNQQWAQGLVSSYMYMCVYSDWPISKQHMGLGWCFIKKKILQISITLISLAALHVTTRANFLNVGNNLGLLHSNGENTKVRMKWWTEQTSCEPYRCYLVYFLLW